MVTQSLGDAAMDRPVVLDRKEPGHFLDRTTQGVLHVTQPRCGVEINKSRLPLVWAEDQRRRHA